MGGFKIWWGIPVFFPLIVFILTYVLYLYKPEQIVHLLYLTDSLFRPSRHKMFASQVSSVSGEVVTRGYLVSTEETSNSLYLWTNYHIQKFYILPEVVFDCYQVDFTVNGKNINEENLWIEFGEYNGLTDSMGLRSTSQQFVRWLSNRPLGTQIILRNGVYTNPNSLSYTDKLWILGCERL